jgi:gliding motility-associated lipoprotein GldH
MKKTRTIFFALFALALLITACDSNQVYKKYESLKNHEWKRDHPIVFDVEIDDIKSNYDVYLAIRHTTYYPYANLLVNVTSYDPNENMRTKDFEFYLRNADGQFKAEGAGDLWDIDFLLFEDISFPEKGVYTYHISNYMPYVSTPDIMEVGLIVKKTEVKDADND